MSKDGTQRTSSSTFICQQINLSPVPKELTVFSSVPLLRRSHNRLLVRHAPSTRRPPQNPCPAVPLNLPRRHPPRDSRRSQFLEAALARHAAICHTYRRRFGALLHVSQCIAPACCKIESPHVHRCGAINCEQRAVLVLELA